MILRNFLKKQYGNTDKFIFVIIFKGIDIINTCYPISFKELHQIIGLSLEDYEIRDYNLCNNKFFKIILKDS